MRVTFSQTAAAILILSAGAAVVVLPGRVFGPERVTAPLALRAAQPVALQARPVKAPVKHRVVTAPVAVTPVVVHVSAPPSKPTTVVRRTVAPRQVVKQVTKQLKVTPKPAKPKPTPPPTTTTPTTTVPATTPPALVAAATPPSTSSVVAPKTDTTPKGPPPGHDKGNGKDHGNGNNDGNGNNNGNGHDNGHGHGHGQKT